VQVLHCVMWPRRDEELPIFGADVVAVGDRVTFAIVDCTPVNVARTLPDTYVDAARLLRAQFAAGMRAADLPPWGAELFSPEVASVRPDLPVEADLVGMHITALCKAHILYSKFVDTHVTPEDASRLAELDRAHRRCGAGTRMGCMRGRARR
jgi:phycocyanobilin:ferredoxin oxidoreductase